MFNCQRDLAHKLIPRAEAALLFSEAEPEQQEQPQETIHDEQGEIIYFVKEA